MNGQRMLRLLLLFLLLPLGGLLAPSAAHATVSCTASMTNLAFGTYDPQAGATNVTATLTWSCSNNNVWAGANVAVCFSIGSGAGGTGQTNPRQIAGGPGSPLLFQLYRDSGHSLIWGSVNTPATPNPVQQNFSIPLAFFGNIESHSGTETLYGVVPGNQTGVTAATYSSLFSGANAMISLQYTETFLGTGTPPASCGNTSNGNFPFTVSANVQQTCSVSAGTLDFGTVAGFLVDPKDAQSMISVKCLNGTAYKVGLDNGQHGVRRMTGPGGSIGYELYRNSGRTQHWGNTPGTDTYGNTGNGNTQNVTVYGRVPPQPTPAAGTYADTVTVTVTY